MFVIVDELHAEPQGRFQTQQQAVLELQCRAAIRWNEEPKAPCTNWLNCGLLYELVEYDDTTSPWKELSRNLMLDISAAGVRWVTQIRQVH
jgi:hypothetical protein